jgi:hypothetical protein
MQAYKINFEVELVVDDASQREHYCIGLGAVRRAFSSMWDTFSLEGAGTAARVQSDCEPDAAFFVAFGLCTALLLEGKAGASEDQAWVRASSLYMQLMAPSRPAKIVKITAARPGIEGVNIPATGESLKELNEWRNRYGLPILAE